GASESEQIIEPVRLPVPQRAGRPAAGDGHAGVPQQSMQRWMMWMRGPESKGHSKRSGRGYTMVEATDIDAAVELSHTRRAEPLIVWALRQFGTRGVCTATPRASGRTHRASSP